MGMRNTAALAAVLGVAGVAGAGNIVVTEFMYQGLSGGNEYIELYNAGSTSVDFAGWKFADAGRLSARLFDLSAFGIVDPGQVLIITEDPAQRFIDDWGLQARVDAGIVKVIGDLGNPALGDDRGQNIGRGDEINIYDADLNLVTRLTYDDRSPINGPRARWAGANAPDPSAFGVNDYSAWVLSEVGDAFGSIVSANGDIGNPGFVIPAPGAGAALLLAGLAGARRRR